MFDSCQKEHVILDHGLRSAQINDKNLKFKLFKKRNLAGNGRNNFGLREEEVKNVKRCEGMNIPALAALYGV